MIGQIIWISVMFLVTVGFLYFAFFGFPVSDALYQKTETFVVNLQSH